MTRQSDTDQLQKEITSLLREKGSRVLAPRDIATRISERLGSVEAEELDAAMAYLEREGKIVAVRGKRYSLLEFSGFSSGRIRVHADGFGTIPSASPDSPGVRIDRRFLRGAMHGDQVLVRVDRKNTTSVRGGKQMWEGEVARVLKRANRLVVGRYHGGDRPWVTPFDIRLDTEISVGSDSALTPREGEMVTVEIDHYPDRSSDARGHLVEVLGMIDEPGVDIEVVIRKYGIPHQFPDEVLAEADAVSDRVSPEELSNREDLRERSIVTIDGETAKDFDDAVEVFMLPNGLYRLGVHIADVSHYVREGSALDREAFERGTSVYFPGRAVPMLPERLSNGICSLNPRVDRLTFSVYIDIDSRGRFVEHRAFRSVIRTKERMTYTDVNSILTEPTAELLERYAPLIDDFKRMLELFEILRKRRQARGSIDFDLPEADVQMGSAGEIEAILPSERNVAHRLIEEFMLAANEVVAQTLVLSNQPGVYRVHQPPDAQRIEDLKNILKEFGQALRANPEEVRPGELQKVIAEIAGIPEERFLTEIILRSMKRALYLEECSGHFALGLQYYSHFTSPIRRYPDLIVHRRLGELISRGPLYGSDLEMVEARHPELAKQSSERERRAEEAEREVLEWKKVNFMRDKVGMEFEGTVTGVVPFGLFVELRELFVQGLIPIASIGGDFWVYFEREHRLRGQSTGRELRLGDSVTIEVKSIDEDRRQIEFRLIALGGTKVEQRKEGRGVTGRSMKRNSRKPV